MERHGFFFNAGCKNNPPSVHLTSAKRFDSTLPPCWPAVQCGDPNTPPSCCEQPSLFLRGAAEFCSPMSHHAAACKNIDPHAPPTTIMLARTLRLATTPIDRSIALSTSSSALLVHCSPLYRAALSSAVGCWPSPRLCYRHQYPNPTHRNCCVPPHQLRWHIYTHSTCGYFPTTAEQYTAVQLSPRLWQTLKKRPPSRRPDSLERARFNRPLLETNELPSLENSRKVLARLRRDPACPSSASVLVSRSIPSR